MRVSPKQPLSVDQEIALGDDAARLLGDEMFNNLLDITEDRILRDWAASDTTAAREQHWAVVRGMMEMQKTLEILAARAKEHRRRQVESAKKSKQP